MLQISVSILDRGLTAFSGLKLRTMKALGILFGICCFALAVTAAEFSKGDQIRLIQDTPLYFKDSTVVRVGKRCELFTIIAARPQEHRVYVTARDARGQ